MTSVIHQPRVAWDLARTTIAVTEAPEGQFRWFAAEFGQLLGVTMEHELRQTRARLANTDDVNRHLVELGRWRVRLEDLLAQDPGLAEDLTRLRLDAQLRAGVS